MTPLAPDVESRQLRLVAIAGPLSGEVLPLDGPELTIGRDPANAICLSDLSLSRRHCAIKTGSPEPRLQDLGSSNGTFVNGMQITEHALSEGDRIQIGESQFLFVRATAGRSAPSDPASVVMRDEPEVPTTKLSIDDAAYLQKDVFARERSSARTERSLRALLTLTTTMNSVRSEGELRCQLFTLVPEVVPANHLAIAVGDDADTTAVHAPQADGAPPLELNRGILRQVLTERVGVLKRDISDDAGGVRGVLCVPLSSRGRTFGAIYLTAKHGAAFDDEDLQLMMAVAAVAATAIENVRYVASLEDETERLQEDLSLGRKLVGTSPAMNRVYNLVRKVKGSDVAVLIEGETGTGKELVARAIHFNSPRAKRPFIAINCAALVETLLEDELFGHERGAFTNAASQKKGKLEVADGGTVFLDEVGELAPAAQGKLLRVLQEREFERVGGTRPIRIDVRVIAATNRRLLDEVAAGRFRQDLYYRLNVVVVTTPPLRERRDDIPGLAQHFIRQFAPKSGRRVSGLSDPALRCLAQYDWPGNVRELENTIERAVVLGSSDQIVPEDLPETLLDSALAQDDDLSLFHASVRDAKARVIREAFHRARGSYLETARVLGLHPNYLHRLIKHLGLKSSLDANT